MRDRFERCAIVGTGLIGASLAGAGKARGLFAHVSGFGRSTANLATALDRGFIDEMATDLGSALAGADLVIVATPVVTAVAQLAEISRLAGPGALVTDVGSVKVPIVAEARRCGLGPRFVGAHPLAGKAETGAGAADVDLFRGRRVVLTPDFDTEPDLLEEMKRLWTVVEAEVSVMEAADHDAVLATSSHLPQMLAFALCATAEGATMREDVIRCVAGGFRDTTRLGASDADMWVDIASLNREAIVDAMDEFREVWEDLRDAVADRDEQSLRTIMAASRAFRREIAGS